MTTPTQPLDIGKLKELLAKATPGPWEQDNILDPDAEYGSGPDPDRGFSDFDIYGADGLKILGTEYAAHKEIEVEQDDEGYVTAWDRIGRANADLVVYLVNAAPSLILMAERVGRLKRPLSQGV